MNFIIIEGKHIPISAEDAGILREFLTDFPAIVHADIHNSSGQVRVVKRGSAKGIKDKDDKKKQAALERQQAEDRALFLKMFEQANKPDPLEERRRASSLAFLDSVEGKNGPFDVTKTPGMEPYLDLYNRAKEGEAADANTDTGMFQLGAGGGDPNLIARMRDQSKMRREERAGGDLADAFSTKYSEVTGSTIPLLMRFKQQRDMGLTDLTAGKSGQSTGLWANFRPQDSIWSKMFQQFSRGAGQAAASMAGGG